MTDTASVTVEVLDVTMLPGRRRLMGLAQVEVTLDGVAIMLQGVRILRRMDGLSYVEPPYYRHMDGNIAPVVLAKIKMRLASLITVGVQADRLKVDLATIYSFVHRQDRASAY